MGEPYKYRRRVRDIVHLIQVNESIHLSDKSRHDIESNIYHAVVEETEALQWRNTYLEGEYSTLRHEGFPLKWNELRLKLARHTDQALDPEDIMGYMLLLDKGVYIRDIPPEKVQEKLREVFEEVKLLNG
jgi:hypothetical protein